jgi:hypothetical protein
MTEPLSFLQVRLASLLGTPACDENAVRILQGNRSQQRVLIMLSRHE